MVMNPGIQTVESYQDRKILAYLGFGGPIVSVVLAADQGDLLAGTVLGKDSSTGKYEKYIGAVAASLITGDADDNNAILFTANQPGTGGNAIKIQLSDPSGNSQALGISISGDTIVVSLATSAQGAITSTAAEVIAAVNSALNVKSLITAANSGESTGAGVVTAVAAAALEDGVDANVTPTVVLAENVSDQPAAVNAEAYLGGVFYSAMLIGMDTLAKKDLGARVVDSVTIVPV